MRRFRVGTWGEAAGVLALVLSAANRLEPADVTQYPFPLSNSYITVEPDFDGSACF